MATISPLPVGATRSVDDGRSDGALLERYATSRDEAAFALLVRRHGTLVLGVCRRILGEGGDADDAFQAVFLVLARQAGSLARRALAGGSLGPWLYRVAYNAAVQGQRGAAARRRREAVAARLRPEGSTMTHTDSLDALSPVLDEELAALPRRLREPVILCALQGRTQRAVSAELGVAEVTIRRRLTRALETLRRRLTRRGVVLSATALAAALAAQSAGAALPASALASACQAGAAGSSLPAACVSIADAVLHTLHCQAAIKLAAASCAALAAPLAVGLAVWAGSSAGPPAAEDAPAAASAAAASSTGTVSRPSTQNDAHEPEPQPHGFADSSSYSFSASASSSNGSFQAEINDNDEITRYDDPAEADEALRRMEEAWDRFAPGGSSP
jgi:RNA polymerase sigma factor (sigma-70 family)